MAKHHLRTEAAVWDAIERGDKPWEIRLNDRFYQPGDTVVLERWRHDQWGSFKPDWDGHEKRTLRRRIGWMLTGGRFGLDAQYVAFTLLPEPESESDEQFGGAARKRCLLGKG